MKNLFAPLNDEEIDQLDWCLLDRVNDDADMEGKDEGLLGISDLDGFFTALVSGPVVILPSRWLPAVWGDFEPVWGNNKRLRACHFVDDAVHERDRRYVDGTATRFEPIFLMLIWSFWIASRVTVGGKQAWLQYRAGGMWRSGK